MQRVIAIICARMGSGRLPGKMLRAAAGRPLLGHLLDRARLVRGVDGIVVATPEHQLNDSIEAFCVEEGISCFRGSEEDLVARTLGALERERADVGIELYGDGPLIDPALVEECLGIFREGTYDLVGNDLKATYPSGMYTEVFSLPAFRDAAERNTDPAIREHGTLFLRLHGELYRTRNVEAAPPLRRPDLHLDCDTEEDFRVIEAILRSFAPRKDFTLGEIIDFLDANPALAESNQHIHRRWKQYQRA